MIIESPIATEGRAILCAFATPHFPPPKEMFCLNTLSLSARAEPPQSLGFWSLGHGIMAATVFFMLAIALIGVAVATHGFDRRY